MSIGFRIKNDWGNLAVDENNPIFIAVGESAGHVDNAGWTDIRLYKEKDGIPPVAIFLEYTFYGVSTSPTPPLVFARPRNVASQVSTVIGYVAAKGAPGAWTGMVVVFTITNLPGNPQNTAQLYPLMRAYMCEFLVVFSGGYISGETHGVRVWAPGSSTVVFDSGNNAVSYKRSNGVWNYSHRDQVLNDQYLEAWNGSDTFGARNEWMLISSIGTGYYMRYNGEVAGSRMIIPGLIGEPVQRLILTGRSGTLIHMPFLFIETRRPVEQGVVLPTGPGPA